MSSRIWRGGLGNTLPGCGQAHGGSAGQGKRFAGVGLNGARASTYCRTGVRKRRGGSIHTLACSRSTPAVLLILRCGNVLRLSGRVARGAPAARAVAGATPQSEGLVRVRGEVEIHTSPPALQRVAPAAPIHPGRGFSAASSRRTSRLPAVPAVTLSGIVGQAGKSPWHGPLRGPSGRSIVRGWPSAALSFRTRRRLGPPGSAGATKV